ncbi:MAG: histidine phosphatase family protein [Propionicimonas sp.]
MGSRARKGKDVTAAGAVVVGGDHAAPEVLLVRQARDDRWRLPLATVDPGEYLAGCAARATQDDAQASVRLGVPVGQLPDPDEGRLVAWWRARATTTRPPTPGAGIEQVAWAPDVDAVRSLACASQQRAVRQALALTDSVPILLVRHTKAMQRSNWVGRDQARPLDARGRRQAANLIPLLAAYGITRLASSTSTRCVKTLLPYAKAERLEIEGWATLSEEQAEKNLKAVDNLMRRLIAQSLDMGTPLAICGHRPVLPTMLTALGIPTQPLQPGACMVAHLSPTGQTLAVEHHPPKA